MSAQHEMQNPGDPPVDITQYVLAPGIGEDGFSLETHAEEGSVGSSEVTFDDPDGTFYPIGLNAYRVRETTSEAADPLIYTGAFGSRTETRGPYRTGASRHVVAQVQDSNSGLSRFIVRVDEDGDRPEETETQRMEWLFTTSGMALHWDISTSIIDTGSTVLGAVDLTDYTLQQVLDDMAQQCGKNYFVFIDGSVDPPEALLVYARDSGTHLTSDLRFSNVEADVDDTTTFFAGLDWELTINPERIRSYISVRGANGREDESDSGTADEFSRVDGVMDAPLLKTSALLTAQALEYLSELDTEETTLKGTVYLPASKASQFRAGMRCEMKASHLTGLTDFVWVRLLSVTVVNMSQDDTLAYALAFEGTFSSSASCATALSSLGDVDDSGNIVIGPLVGETGYEVAEIPAGEGVTFAFVGGAVDTGNFVTDIGGIAVNAPWAEVYSEAEAESHHATMVSRHTNGTAETPDYTWDGPSAEQDQSGIRQFGLHLLTQETSPVQTATDVTSESLPFASDLTPGNIVIAFRHWYTAPFAGTWAVPAGWTVIQSAIVVNQGSEDTQLGMDILARCVQEGDGDTYEFTMKGGGDIYAEEWALT